MSGYYSSNKWVYNCAKEDMDAYASWDEITIQRNQLRRVTYSSSFWNEKTNSTESKENVIEYNPPVSSSVVLATRNQMYPFAYLQAPDYFGNRYVIEGTLTIISGPQQNIQDEEYTNTSSGCLTRNDPNYDDRFNCTPPDSPCSQ